jgi:hypothetical protein
MRLVALPFVLALAPAAAADPPAAAPPLPTSAGFLGWTDDGAAVASYYECNDGSGWCGEVVLVADDAGMQYFELPHHFVRQVVRAPDGAPLWIERRPVQVDVRRVSVTDQPDRIVAIVTAGARELERRVVVADGSSNDGIGNVTFDVHPSPDGARVAVEVSYRERIAEWTDDVHQLLVFGPPPLAPVPDAPEARDDIVELRHGRAFVPRITGFTADGSVVARDRLCDGTDCSIFVRIASADGDGASVGVGRFFDATLPTEHAAAWIANEGQLLRTLGPLTPAPHGPARCGGARVRANVEVADMDHVRVIARAGATRWTTTVSLDLEGDDPYGADIAPRARVVSLAPAPDDTHVVAMIETHSGRETGAVETRPVLLTCPAP